MGHGSVMDQLIPEDSSQRQESGNRLQSSDSSSEQGDSESESVPKGPTYPLNSKRVKAVHL